MFPLLRRERVAARLELHPQWSALELKSFLEVTFQITPITVRYVLQGIAVHDDDRGIHAALVLSLIHI